jgi:hypothetical protein
MHRLKTFLTVIGAVTILVLAANTVAYAATGGKFILGKTNKANKVTTLKRTTSGAALNLVTKPSTTAPFTVNSNGTVANLNADMVDGHDTSYFASRSQVLGLPASREVAFGQINGDGTSLGITGTATVTRTGTGLYNVTIPGARPGCTGPTPTLTLTPFGDGYNASIFVYSTSCVSGDVTLNVIIRNSVAAASDDIFWFTLSVPNAPSPFRSARVGEQRATTCTQEAGQPERCS